MDYEPIPKTNVLHTKGTSEVLEVGSYPANVVERPPFWNMGATNKMEKEIQYFFCFIGQSIKKKTSTDNTKSQLHFISR